MSPSSSKEKAHTEMQGSVVDQRWKLKSTLTSVSLAVICLLSICTLSVAFEFVLWHLGDATN